MIDTTIFGWALAVLVASIALSLSYMRPRLVWYLVIGGAISFSGLVIAQISYIDEIVVVCVVIGVILSSSRYVRRVPSGFRTENVSAHLVLFLFTCVYMGMQAFRGLAITGSSQKLRWVVYFVLLAIVAIMMWRGQRKLPGRRSVAILCVATGFVYFLMYSTVGLAYESLGFGSRYDIQNVLWGGTTYAAFPLVVILPASLYLVRSKESLVKYLSWATIALIIWQAFYYSSRVSWESLIVIFLASIFMIGLHRVLILAVIVSGFIWISLTVLWPAYYDLGTFGNILIRPIQSIFGSPQDSSFSEFSRLAHVRIGFDVIRTDKSIFLIGTGLRTSGPYVGPALVEYFTMSGMGRYSLYVANQASTVGSSTLLIETGVIGFLLYLGNFTFAMRAIMRAEKSKYRYTLIASLGITAAWSMVTNPFDIILLHLLIMPSGILILLTSGNQEVTRLPRRGAEP